jgi:uncharacterized membrane protein YhaH (DUF805 family)
MQNPYAAPQAGLEFPLEAASATRLFAWNSRIGRARFVAYTFAGLVFAVFYFAAVGAVGRALDMHYTYGDLAVWGHMAIVLLAPVLALVNATRRRLHDFDVSAWWALFLLFPFFQFVFLIYLLVAPGTPNANRFGPVPPPNEWSVLAAAVLGGLALLWLIVLRSP